MAPQSGQERAKEHNWKTVETKQINNLQELRDFITRLNQVTPSPNPNEVFIYNEEGKSPTVTLRVSETAAGSSHNQPVYDCMIT